MILRRTALRGVTTTHLLHYFEAPFSRHVPTLKRAMTLPFIEMIAAAASLRH